jgi:hypothetical protein
MDFKLAQQKRSNQSLYIQQEGWKQNNGKGKRKKGNEE